MTYLSLVHNWLVTCSWLINCSWLILTCSWHVHEIFMTCLRLQLLHFWHPLKFEFLMTCSYLIHNLFMTHSWLVYDMFIIWSQHPWLTHCSLSVHNFLLQFFVTLWIHLNYLHSFTWPTWSTSLHSSVSHEML